MQLGNIEAFGICMSSSKRNCWSIAWVISPAIDPSNSLSWIGRVSVEWNFKGAKSGKTKHSVALQSTRAGTGVLLICRMTTESKKAAEEVDDKTVYKGSIYNGVTTQESPYMP